MIENSLIENSQIKNPPINPHQSNNQTTTKTNKQTNNQTNNEPIINELPQSIQLIQLKQKDIPKYRDLIIKEQQGLCAICKETLPIDEKNGISLDHQHRTKNEPVGQNGAGLIRGVLCRDCNVFEGKIWNNSKRYGKFKTLPQFLRAVADYLEKENYPYIHPTEEEKPQRVSKRQYNLLIKAHKAHNNKTIDKKPNNEKPNNGKKNNNMEIPPFPEKRKPSQKLLNLFATYNISPYL